MQVMDKRLSLPGNGLPVDGKVTVHPKARMESVYKAEVLVHQTARQAERGATDEMSMRIASKLNPLCLHLHLSMLRRQHNAALGHKRQGDILRGRKKRNLGFQIELQTNRVHHHRAFKCGGTVTLWHLPYPCID